VLKVVGAGPVPILPILSGRDEDARAKPGIDDVLRVLDPRKNLLEVPNALN